MGIIQVLTIPEVRVSTAGFAVIKDGSGRYALTINPKRSNKVLTPVGGGLEATNNGIGILKVLLDIGEDAFEEGNGLRFTMSGSKAEEYRKWFLSGEDRDDSPQREVFEELVDEHKFLNLEDLEGMLFERLGYGVELSDGTRRVGADGNKPTLRILEIFDTKLKSKTLQKLVELSEKEDSLIRFVTKEEIENGQTDDGIKIAINISRFLFDFETELPGFV